MKTQGIPVTAQGLFLDGTSDVTMVTDGDGHKPHSSPLGRHLSWAGRVRPNQHSRKFHPCESEQSAQPLGDRQSVLHMLSTVTVFIVTYWVPGSSESCVPYFSSSEINPNLTLTLRKHFWKTEVNSNRGSLMKSGPPSWEGWNEQDKVLVVLVLPYKSVIKMLSISNMHVMSLLPTIWIIFYAATNKTSKPHAFNMRILTTWYIWCLSWASFKKGFVIQNK